jgi:hypothetical protein
VRLRRPDRQRPVGVNGQPFTGPGDAQLPLGAGLLAAGAAIVVLARYRPRHARR